ncbi:MAG: DUF1638 domain-containing protein [Spirochaetaceae bacterium]|jgi:hypothetical protein|nr:DUF1638 domain-containing protein [Spirochaetaceae bacterium]
MSINCIACGIFQFELEKVLPEICAELGCEVHVDYTEPGLDTNADTLEQAVTEKINGVVNNKIMLLFGSMCHTEWQRITEKSGARYPKPANCAEMMLSPEKKKAIDGTGNVYYLTMGGLKLWKSIYQNGHGWDDVDARQNFCYFDKIILLDTGIFPVADEDLFEFFEYTQVPIEVEKISLDHFKSVVKEITAALL